MDDENFFDALADPQHEAKREAQAFFAKKAAVPALAQAGVEFVRQHATQIGAALAGGAALTAGQYALNKRKKDGSASPQQKAQTALLNAAQSSADEAKSLGHPMTFKQDLGLATAKGMKDVSDVLARHPGKGALLALPAGAAAGWRLAKALT